MDGITFHIRTIGDLIPELWDAINLDSPLCKGLDIKTQDDVPTACIHEHERSILLAAAERAATLGQRFPLRKVARYIGVDHRILRKISSGSYDGLRREALTYKQREMLHELYAPARLGLFGGDPNRIENSMNEWQSRFSVGEKTRRDGKPLLAMKMV